MRSLIVADTWNDPATLPSARARERVGQVVRGNPELMAIVKKARKNLEKDLEKGGF